MPYPPIKLKSKISKKFKIPPTSLDFFVSAVISCLFRSKRIIFSSAAGVCTNPDTSGCVILETLWNNRG